jgi:hypothetical protein
MEKKFKFEEPERPFKGFWLSAFGQNICQIVNFCKVCQKQTLVLIRIGSGFSESGSETLLTTGIN